MSEFKNTTMALGVAILMCFTAFVGVNIATNESDAGTYTAGTHIYMDSDYYDFEGTSCEIDETSRTDTIWGIKQNLYPTAHDNPPQTEYYLPQWASGTYEYGCIILDEGGEVLSETNDSGNVVDSYGLSSSKPITDKVDLSLWVDKAVGTKTIYVKSGTAFDLKISCGVSTHNVTLNNNTSGLSVSSMDYGGRVTGTLTGNVTITVNGVWANGTGTATYNIVSVAGTLTSLNYQMQSNGADAGTSWTIATGSYVNIKPFEDQGGSDEFGSVISSVTPSGSGLNSSGCGRLIKAGTYTLNGHWWNGSNSGNFTYTIKAVGDEYFPHTVKYNANGGSGTIDDKVVYSPASGSVSVPIGDGSGFTKSGYKVIGWNTAANGSGTNYNLNSSVSVAKNGTVTLYAQWGVDEGNGSQSNPLSSINKNVTIKDKDATIYVRVGASVDLKGWGEEAEGISWHSGKGLGLTEYESGGFEYVAYGLHGTITQAGTLQTVWWVLCDPDGNYDSEFTLTIVAVASSYTHTVTYAANGGSGTTANTVVTDQTNGNSSVTLASNGFTKSGYHFVGWKVGNTVYQPGAKVSVGANATVTATAQWEANTLTLGSVAKQYAVAGHNVTFTVSAMSNPSGASISFAKSNVSNGLTVSISGNVVTCSASTPGTYTFTLTASATGYTSASTTVTVQVVPVLAFTNSPTAGALNA